MVTLMVQTLFSGRTLIEPALWGAVLMFILWGIGWTVRREQRRYQAVGKREAWLRLRLSSLPILVVTALAVWLPARAVSGPTALGFFYAALIAIVPITWFGLHRITGSLVSPRLTKAESDRVALTGIAMVIVPALLVSMLQGPVFMASRRWTQSLLADAEHTPLAHGIQPMQRFRLGDQGDLCTQTLHAPSDVRLFRVDALLGGDWHDTQTTTHSYFCRQGDDLHLAWPAGSLPPALRLFWYNTRDRLVQAEFRIDPAAAERLPVREFAVGWREDGIDLPAPVSRDTVQLGWTGKADPLYYRSLNPLQPGETFQNDCVMAGYRRVAWEAEGPITRLILTLNPHPPGTPLQYEARRSE